MPTTSSILIPCLVQGLLLGLVTLPIAAGTCSGDATRTGKNEAAGKRCCFDDLIFAPGVTAEGWGCKPGEWINPKAYCTIKENGKMVASVNCCKSNSNDRCNGEFLLQCSSTKNKVTAKNAAGVAYGVCGGGVSGGGSSPGTTNSTGPGIPATAVTAEPTVFLVAVIATIASLLMS